MNLQTITSRPDNSLCPAFEAQMREVKDSGAKLISNREIYADNFVSSGQRIVVGKKTPSPSKKGGEFVAADKFRRREFDDTSTLCGASPTDGGGTSDANTISLVSHNTADFKDPSADGAGVVQQQYQPTLGEDRNTWKEEVLIGLSI